MTHPSSTDDAILDSARLAEIARLGLADATGDDAVHAALAEIAAQLDVPTVIVSAVLDGAQRFLAGHGLTGWMAEAGGVPIEWSFCRFPVAAKAPFVVEDATTHPLVRDNPVVANDGIGCYAGVPLVTSRGLAVGSLCVSGGAPRAFTNAEIERLRAAAAALVEHLEGRAPV